MTITVVGDPARANARYFKKLEEINLPHYLMTPRAATLNQLQTAHAVSYATQALDGWSEEWIGRRPDLGQRAAESAGAAVQGAALLHRDQARRVIVPNGGKIHAGYDTSDRGCVFNDVVMAADWLSRRGTSVAVIDLDGLYAPQAAEHLANNPLVMTVSVHDETPGKAHEHDPEHGVFNYMLAEDSGDAEMLNALDAGLLMVEAFCPETIICVVGSTGHVDDELTTLEYSLDGIYEAVLRVAITADRLCGGRMMTMGGVASAGSEWGSTIFAAATHAVNLPYLASSARRNPPRDIFTPDLRTAL